MFNGRSNTSTMTARRKRWMITTITLLISIGSVSSMSLDRLALERNELPAQPVANEEKGQPPILVDDLKLTAAPNGGNTDTYMLIPASVANQLDQSANVILNTIDTVPESSDLETDLANPNSDMLMLETDQGPAMQMVALPSDITVAEAPAAEPVASESMELISDHVVDLHKPISQEEVQLENVEQAVDTTTEQAENEQQNEEHEQAQELLEQQQDQEQPKEESVQQPEESGSTESLAHIMADAVDLMEKDIEEAIEPAERQQDVEKEEQSPTAEQSVEKDTTEASLMDSMVDGIEESLIAAMEEAHQEEQSLDTKDEEKKETNEEQKVKEKEEETQENVAEKEGENEEEKDEEQNQDTTDEEKNEEKKEEENEVKNDDDDKEEEKKIERNEEQEVAKESEQEEAIVSDKETEEKQEIEQEPQVQKEAINEKEEEVIENNDESEADEEKKPEVEQETDSDKQEETEPVAVEPVAEKDKQTEVIKEDEIPQQTEAQKEAEKDKDAEKEDADKEVILQQDEVPAISEIQTPVEENEVEPQANISSESEDNLKVESVQAEEEKKEESIESEIQPEQSQAETTEAIQTETEPEKADTTNESETEIKPETAIIEEPSKLNNIESLPINNEPVINDEVEDVEPLTKPELTQEQQPIQTIQADEVEKVEQQPQPESEPASILTTIIPMVSIQPEPEKPLQVTDSVLNYVNASFMQPETDLPKVEPETGASFNAHLRRYDGAQVWRIVVQTDKDKKMADELQTKYDGQLWKEVKQEVDYLLKPQVLAAAERHIRAANLSRTVLIDNLQQVIEVENPPADKIAELQNRKGHRLTWQAYHRLEDIHGYMDYMAETYSTMCSTEIIGYSVEKRPLKILKISNGNPRNPGVWIDGGMHAREWISPATVTFIANQLIEGWEDLPEHMRNINWYIHPVANPDGYEYSHTTDRLWRKNMRAHGRQCPGVDLNRNFGYKWGGKGTSASPCSQTYRGSKAFSEPETFYISKFISGFPRETFQAYLSFHSYGQYILYPWGYDYHLTQDRADLDRVARQAGTSITKSTGVKYTVGSSATTLYPAAGGSDDWAKGIAGIKYAYTIEMGDTGRYGFILPARFIQYNGKDGYTFADTVARAIAQGRSGGQARRRRH